MTKILPEPLPSFPPSQLLYLTKILIQLVDDVHLPSGKKQVCFIASIP